MHVTDYVRAKVKGWRLETRVHVVVPGVVWVLQKGPLKGFPLIISALDSKNTSYMLCTCMGLPYIIYIFNFKGITKIIQYTFLSMNSCSVSMKTYQCGLRWSKRSHNNML